MKKSLTVFALIVLAALVYQFRSPEAIPVVITKASKGLVQQTVHNSRAGSVKACQRSKLSLSIGGKVEKLLVEEGDQVSEGQLLLSLWNQDHLALLQQQNAQLEANRLGETEICLQASSAHKEAQRQESLIKQQLTTEHQLLQAQTLDQSLQASCAQASVLVAQAEAAVARQQAILSQTQLHAPFSGVVAQINGEVGEFVTPSPPGVATPPAVDLIDTSCLYVTVPIDEIDVAKLAVGQPAYVTLDAIRDQRIPATVSRISPYVQELERQARTVDVDLSLDLNQSDKLLIGYSADASIVLDSADNTLRVPSQYILDDSWIFLVNAQSRVEKRQLQLGLKNWNWSQVLSGLSAGDQVITSLDIDNLREGSLVSITEQTEQVTHD